MHPALSASLDAAIIALMVTAPVGLAYFIRGWYRVRPPRPSLFTLLVITSTLGLVAGLYLGTISHVRIVDRVVPPWALPELSAIATIALLLPIVLMALFLFRISASPDIFQPGPKGDPGEKGDKGDPG
jgi:hypothetical protein